MSLIPSALIFIGEDKINLTDPNGVAIDKDLADALPRGEDSILISYFLILILLR